MTELLFLKFNLASPQATDANVRMSKSEESSRNYQAQADREPYCVLGLNMKRFLVSWVTGI